MSATDEPTPSGTPSDERPTPSETNGTGETAPEPAYDPKRAALSSTRSSGRRRSSSGSPIDGLRPGDFAKFGRVVKRLHRSEPSGWREMRDTLLLQYEVFKQDMPGYAVLKAAMEAQRQASMCEVAVGRTKTEQDVDKYREFQRYLAGDVDLPAGPTPPPQEIAHNGHTVSIPPDDRAPLGDEDANEEHEA